MSWIMVPVREDIVPAVEVLLFQLKFQGKAPVWDEARMEEHLLSLSTEARAVLSMVADGVIAGSPLEDRELAERLSVSVHEVFGLVRDANDVTTSASPGDLLHSRLEDADDVPEGSRRRRVVYMLEGLAEMVRDRERALGLGRPSSPPA